MHTFFTVQVSVGDNEGPFLLIWRRFDIRLLHRRSVHGDLPARICWDPRKPMKLQIRPLLFAVSLLPSIPLLAAERYEIDPVHSSATFRVKHLFSYVNGRFNDVQGTIVADPSAPEDAHVEVTIKTASVDSHEEKRDDHLRSPEFFDAAQYPEITFKSKKANITGNDSAFVTGDLSMHGVTKEVILQVKFLGKGPGPDGRQHTGWEAKTALKRSDFGLTWSKTIEGTQLVGDDIEIGLEIDAVQTKGGPSEADASAVPPPPEKPNTPPTGNLSKPPPAAIPPGSTPPLPPGTPSSPAPAAPTPQPAGPPLLPQPVAPAPANPPQVLPPGAPLAPPSENSGPRGSAPAPGQPAAPGTSPVPPAPQQRPPGHLPKSA